MNEVYIWDNHPATFSSLLMNDFSNYNVRFNNINTTKSLYYDNILIYIPPDISMLSDDELLQYIKPHKELLRLFSVKVIPIINSIIYTKLKAALIKMGIKHFKFYQACDYNTLFSSIIVNDCDKLLTKVIKLHNK